MSRRRCLGRTLFLLVIVTVVVCVPPDARPQDADQRPVSEARIFFVPFGVETIVAIRIDTIEKQAWFVIWFRREAETPDQPAKSHPFVRKLHRLLTSRPSREFAHSIRLKADLPQGTYFVDWAGRVLEQRTGRHFQLTKREMEEVERDITYLWGVVDMEASERLRR